MDIQAVRSKTARSDLGWTGLTGGRLSHRVAGLVFLCIVVVEAVILIPSYINYERDLITRIEQVGRAYSVSSFENLDHHGNHLFLKNGRRLVQSGRIAGGVLYEASGHLIGTFGTQPDLSAGEFVRTSTLQKRSPDGDWLDVVWPATETGLPITFAARLDIRWIRTELVKFVFRIGGLVLIISLSVCAGTMLILNKLVLLRIRALSERIGSTNFQAGQIDEKRTPPGPDDELGDLITAVNDMIETTARSFEDVAEARAALVKINEGLEKQVEARTRDHAEAEAAARWSEQRFRDFSVTSSDWFWEMDENLRFSYFSDRFTEVTGVPIDALMGKTRQESGIPNVDPAAWEKHLANLAAHRPFRRFIHPRTKPDGSIVHLSINGSPIFDEGGKFMGYRGTGSEITEIVEAEQAVAKARDELELRVLARTQELHAAKDDAEIASQAKTHFLANMSHELRTPLNAIIGFSEMIQSEVLGPLGNDNYKEYLTLINQSGAQLLGVLSEILDLSKIEAGAAEIEEEELNVAQTVVECAKMVLSRAQIKGVQLDAAVPHALPSLRADRVRIKQILLNLIDNAVKFTPAGGMVVASAERKGDAIVLRVRDTDIGIAEEDMSRVREPFGQAADIMTRRHDGSGLGLPLAKKMAELHGASLTIDSNPGKGTTVSVAFPKERTIELS